jgi:F0F1-type ATP synthase assembly protein I
MLSELILFLILGILAGTITYRKTIGLKVKKGPY